MMRKLALPSFFFASWVCSFSVGSNPGSPITAGASAFAEAPPHRTPPQPPREAVEACSRLAVSDACTVSLHGHTIEGTCRTPPDGKGELACIPKRPHMPPPEAVEACSGLSVSAACTITLHGHVVDGTCRSGPDGNGALACLPHHPPPSPN